jgi:ribosomal protein S18 acetylase RimI-like enzyme
MTTIKAAQPLLASGATVELVGAPAVPGLRFRRWRDEADLDAFVAVVNASWAADGIDIRTGPENEATEMLNLTAFQLERDFVFAERDGTVVGFARANSDTEDDGTRRHWITMMLAPSGRGIGLEDVLVDWAEGHHRELASAEDGAVARRFGVWAAELEGWWVDYAQGRGYRPVRWFTDMVRETLDDLPERSLPPGLEIRPVLDEAGMRRVLAAMDEAFRDHWGHSPQTEQDIRSVIDHPYNDPSLWAVAWAGDEVAGAVVATEMFDDNAAFGWRRGWLNTVGTRRPWRGMGVASALIVRALETIKSRGLTSAALGVDTENPSGALGLYERLGFRTDLRFLILFRPFDPPA